MPGDSGTEGGGSPGNELLLSTFDGKVYQTSTFNIVSIPSTQAYRLSFDAHDIFTIHPPDMANNTGYGSPLTNPSQLTARLYYGASRTTLLSQTINFNLTGSANYVMTVPGGSAALTPALGQPIGVEFDDTTYENSVALNTSSAGKNPIVVNDTSGSWGGVDNVILQIAGTLNGDLNGDGVVDILDYRVIRDHLQSNVSYLANGDMNGDGKVDLNDFRAWTKIVGPLPGAASFGSGSVPEPSSCFLALCGGAAVAGMIGRRRRWSIRRLRSVAVVAPPSARRSSLPQERMPCCWRMIRSMTRMEITRMGFSPGRIRRSGRPVPRSSEMGGTSKAIRRACS